MARSHIILLIGAALPLVACERSADRGIDGPPAQNVAEPASPIANAVASIPYPETTLDREQLILAAIRAASDQASGKDDAERQSALAGKQFTIRIRFGCEGPAEHLKAAPLGWSYDEEGRALRARASPTLTHDAPLMKSFAGPAAEAVEGFWVPRPWLLSDACPSGDAAVQGSAPPRPTLGIAQFFTAADSRARRRSQRPYETVQKIEPEGAPQGQGLNLILNGRLKARENGKVIQCTAADPNAPPICVLSVELDLVSIENPSTSAVLAEWGGS